MKFRIALIWAFCSGAAVAATDFPTVDRVEFVLECMRSNGGEYHFLYKCSCAIDAIAAQLPYEKYVDASSVSRYQNMGGERAGVFRDPDSLKDMGKSYRSLQAQAYKQCDIERKP